MNYLDILPNDVMKIINRKLQDAQIIKRRTERKENKRIQREKKQIADNKKRIYSKKIYMFFSLKIYLKNILYIIIS